MKYKVGDKVRVREDLDENTYYNGIPIHEDMINDYGGKKAIIKRIKKIDDCFIGYNLDISGSYWIWTDEMLESIVENIAESDENTDEVVNTSVETIDKNGQKDKKSTVKSGQFTKENFKFGDIVTLRNGEQGIKSGIRIDFDSGEYHYLDEFTDVFLYEPAYSLDEFTDVFLYEPAHSDLDIMKVERYIKNQNGSYDLVTLYERKEEILTEEEKEWLKNIISAFEVKVLFIRKDSDDFQIKLGIAETFYPTIKLNLIKYKFEGMEDGKEYTLEELGL